MYHLQQADEQGTHWSFIAVRQFEDEIHRLLDFLLRRDRKLHQRHRYRIVLK